MAVFFHGGLIHYFMRPNVQTSASRFDFDLIFSYCIRPLCGHGIYTQAFYRLPAVAS
jgi:hypothetical protein